MLNKDWTKWDAYKLGIIDKDGNRTDKKIESNKEEESWNFFNRVVAKLRKLLFKFLPKSKVTTIITTLLLLKENVTAYDAENYLKETIDDGIKDLKESQKDQIKKAIIEAKKAYEETMANDVAGSFPGKPIIKTKKRKKKDKKQYFEKLTSKYYYG